MDVVSQRTSSSLNPNAPLFVPCAYREVEDFSDQWWELVRSSPWFRDYWLRECFQDPQNDLDLFQYDEPLLPDTEAIFDGYSTQDEEEKEYCRDLISLRTSKLRRPRSLAETPKYFDKAPKIVNVKLSPRPIQQPR